MPTESSSPYLPFGENKNAPWFGKDILSVKQFSREDLEYVFGVAHEMRGMVERVGTFDLLKGKMARIGHLEAYSTISVELRERKKPGLLGYIGLGVYHAVKWLFVRN